LSSKSPEKGRLTEKKEEKAVLAFAKREGGKVSRSICGPADAKGEGEIKERIFSLCVNEGKKRGGGITFNSYGRRRRGGKAGLVALRGKRKESSARTFYRRPREDRKKNERTSLLMSKKRKKALFAQKNGRERATKPPSGTLKKRKKEWSWRGK